jgi:hypothetical protein
MAGKKGGSLGAEKNFCHICRDSDALDAVAQKSCNHMKAWEDLDAFGAQEQPVGEPKGEEEEAQFELLY